MPELPGNADPVPATPIGEMQQWRLEVQCGRCRRRVVLPIRGLAECLGGQTRVGAVIRRLRCAGTRGGVRCWGRPDRVMLVQVATYGKTTRKLREVQVRTGIGLSDAD